MKATLKNNSDIDLNIGYLQTVGGLYTYFVVPAAALNAELLQAVNVDGPVTDITRTGNGDTWQIQIKSDMITWED